MKREGSWWDVDRIRFSTRLAMRTTYALSTYGSSCASRLVFSGLLVSGKAPQGCQLVDPLQSEALPSRFTQIISRSRYKDCRSACVAATRRSCSRCCPGAAEPHTNKLLLTSYLRFGPLLQLSSQNARKSRYTTHSHMFSAQFEGVARPPPNVIRVDPHGQKAPTLTTQALSLPN